MEDRPSEKCRECGAPTRGERLLCDACWALYRFERGLDERFIDHPTRPAWRSRAKSESKRS